MAAVVVPPPAAAPAPAPAAFEPQDFGMELERASAATPGPVSSHGGGGRELAIDVAGSDAFDLEIERGGAITSQAPASSPRAGAPASRPGSGLDVAYRRTDPKPASEEDDGPSSATRALAVVLPAVLFVGAFAGLAKLVHRRGGHVITTLLPHAFDASSTAQSGAVSGLALVLAIAVGVLGLRARPRSYAMLVSAAALVITMLAMVTVALVSTEEHPGPADGALVVPYVIPFALMMLGLGVAGRARPLFLRGGASRVTALVAGIAGGAIVFVALEISALASRLP